MTAAILIVEDELHIGEGLRDHLGRNGYRPSIAATLAAARSQLDTDGGSPDLVVLDRRLPDGDGLELLRELRERGDRTPVIVLSALGEVEDRVSGFDVGADDYLVKPFHLRELLARIRAVLARAETDNAEALADRYPFGEFELDVARRELRRGTTEIPLPKMEFELLLFLVRHPSRAWSRHELLESVWGHEHFPTTRTVDYHVMALRKKVEENTSFPRHLLTVHRVGYRFEP